MNARAEAADTNDKARILIVDDHPIVRQGITLLVDQESGMMVCGEAASAAEALEAIERSKPTLAIVDLSLKESSGLELIKDIRIRYPKLLVLVLSMRDESFYAERVLRAGARGYITKEEETETVIKGIRRVLAGQIYLSDKLASRVLSKLVDGRGAPGSSRMSHLTDRELEVLQMIGNGMATRGIAQRLHLSIKTIESHREHIKHKLQLDNATELLQHAIQWVRCQGT